MPRMQGEFDANKRRSQVAELKTNLRARWTGEMSAPVAQGGDYNVGPKHRAVFADTPAPIFDAAFARADLQFALRFVRFSVGLRIKLGKMLADDLLFAVALQQLRASIPSTDVALRVQHEDRIVANRFHEQAKAILAVLKRSSS